MASTLRDDLASLKINRREPERITVSTSTGPGRRRGGGGGGLGLATVLLWMIPLGLLGTAGFVAYRQVDKIRAKPEVTVGLVQAMTSGEAEKLLSAKGYLKSRFQSMIGATIPGRVERMFVEEG